MQYVFGGLLLGLVLGMGFVIVGALASDRLRRRDDIARALGAPVQLSVGRIRIGGLRGPRGLAAAKDPELQRIVGHLRNVMPNAAARPPALAVIPADNPRVAAVAAVSLALSLAKERKAVLFADLSGGAYAAKLLGVARRGSPGRQRGRRAAGRGLPGRDLPDRSAAPGPGGLPPPAGRLRAVG